MSYIDFETGFMVRLKKAPYMLLYKEIIDIIEEARFTNSYLLEMLGILKSHDFIDDLSQNSGKHNNTPKIQDLYKERRDKLADLRDIIDKLPSIEGFFDPKVAKDLRAWLGSFRQYIGTRNALNEYKAVREIEYALNYNDDTRDSLQKANMIYFLETLVAINDKIVELEEEREDDRASGVLGIENKLLSYKDMKIMLAVLNSLIRRGKEESELARRVGEKVNHRLRRERGYVRMVDTKKQKRDEKEKGEEGK